VHRTSYRGPLGWWKSFPNRLPPRPNCVSAGGVALKVENATTQPSCVRDRQARTCLKIPPVSRPLRTVTFPPSRIADTSRRATGFPSTRVRISSCRCPAPCECPISTTPRPWLYLARYSFHAAATSPYAVRAAAAVIDPLVSDGTVSWRYTGANTRHTCENRAAW
jgi:hypothetical protein